MILRQKTLLVRTITLFIAVLISSSKIVFADDIFIEPTSEDNICVMKKEISPFSIIKKELYNSNKKDIPIIEQSLIQGETISFDNAKIRLLEYNTGMSTYYEIQNNINYQYDKNINIILHDCKREIKNILNPLNIALISIKDKDKVIFKGWIFSNNFSVQLPQIKDHIIYLERCGNNVINLVL